MPNAIKDYLHLYLGCDVEVRGWKGKLAQVGSDENQHECVISMQNQDEESGFYGEWGDLAIKKNLL